MDDLKARELLSDGSYRRVTGDNGVSAQSRFMEEAEDVAGRQREKLRKETKGQVHEEPNGARASGLALLREREAINSKKMEYLRRHPEVMAMDGASSSQEIVSQPAATAPDSNTQDAPGDGFAVGNAGAGSVARGAEDAAAVGDAAAAGDARGAGDAAAAERRQPVEETKRRSLWQWLKDFIAGK